LAMEKEKILEALKQKFPDSIEEVSVQFGDEIISIDCDSLLDIVRFLKEKPYDFAMLLDITCVDYKGEKRRFEMVYHLFSLSQNNRLRIKARLHEKDPTIDSLTSLWNNANWLERNGSVRHDIRCNIFRRVNSDWPSDPGGRYFYLFPVYSHRGRWSNLSVRAWCLKIRNLQEPFARPPTEAPSHLTLHRCCRYPAAKV